MNKFREKKSARMKEVERINRSNCEEDKTY